MDPIQHIPSHASGEPNLTQAAAAPSPAAELLRAEQITKRFVQDERELTVVRDATFSLAQGEVVAIVGPSGAGKSTLLHIVGTLDLPTSGKIIFAGENITARSEASLADFRNRTLGFVFQFHHLLPDFTALENIMLPGLIGGLTRGDAKRRADELLNQVGLADRRTHRPAELSGGEKQRVAIARALVMAPRLVLADEPTGNLDSRTSEAIHALLFDLNREHGTTFLIVTHSRELAERVPRVIRMRDGRIEDDSVNANLAGNMGFPGRSSS